MITRLRLVFGILMLGAGAAALVSGSRVFSTFVLELVVQTLDLEAAKELPPYEFSWGMMYWGNFLSDFSVAFGGLMLIALGQLAILPVTVLRVGASGSRLAKAALVGSAVMTLIAGGCFFMVPRASIGAFGMIASSGAVDPVGLGEMLAVRANAAFAICLAAAQILLVLAMIFAGKPQAANVRKIVGPGRVLSWLACVCLLGFALAIGLVFFGPVRELSDYEALVREADPARIAGQLSLALRTMLFSTGLLTSAGVLTLVAALLSGRRLEE